MNNNCITDIYPITIPTSGTHYDFYSWRQSYLILVFYHFSSHSFYRSVSFMQSFGFPVLWFPWFCFLLYNVSCTRWAFLWTSVHCHHRQGNLWKNADQTLEPCLYEPNGKQFFVHFIVFTHDCSMCSKWICTRMSTLQIPSMLFTTSTETSFSSPFPGIHIAMDWA